MTEQVETVEAVEPAPGEPAERGRYALYQQPDGSALIARASGICERCAGCGCGEQQPPIGPVPAFAFQAFALMRDGRIPEAMRLVMKNGMPGALKAKGPRRARK
jgi:hypothetical protein